MKLRKHYAFDVQAWRHLFERRAEYTEELRRRRKERQLDSYELSWTREHLRRADYILRSMRDSARRNGYDVSLDDPDGELHPRLVSTVA